MPTAFKIRPYQLHDETLWVRCRVLAFLDSAYFDDVVQTKPVYENPAIELVAESATGKIIGVLDLECEEVAGTVCSARPGLGGMIWNLGVHPDYRRQGVARRLLEEAIALATSRHIQRFEAYTRDDPFVLVWYEAQGFRRIEHYLHVYLNAEEAQVYLSSTMPGFKPVSTFAHYSKDPTQFSVIRKQFDRVHDCHLLELRLS